MADDAVQVIDHTGVSGIVILRTPVETTQDVIDQELQDIPGFKYVEEYDPAPDAWPGADPSPSGDPLEEDLSPPPDWSPPIDSYPTEGGANLNVGLTGNEPTIAVNPFNANNIIVAQFNNGLQSMKISLDGGSTFPAL